MGRLGRMVNLERLTISSHQIGGPLPEELGNLGNLESMCLGHPWSWYLRLRGVRRCHAVPDPGVVWDVDDYQMASSDWTVISASVRPPALLGGPTIYRGGHPRRWGSSPFIRVGFTGGMLAVGQSLPVRERYIGPNRPLS